MKKTLPILLVLPLFISSCSGENTPEQKTFFACGTYFQVSSYNTTLKQTSALEDEILKYSKLFDGFSTYKNIVNIKTINETNDEIKVSKELYDALNLANEYYLKTDGVFNPYLGELTYAYKESYEKNELPNNAIIKEGLNNLKTFDFKLNRENLTVQRVGNSKIDLGAFAKGYVIDVAKEFAKNNGINNYFISGGGSSNYFTTKPEDQPFTASIKYLDKEYLEMKNSSIGISSIYEQYITINNQKYSHIIDPKSGMPSMLYDFSIVKHESATLTDIFSTVLMLLDDKNTIDKYKNEFNFDYIIYKDNKLLYKTDGINLLKY